MRYIHIVWKNENEYYSVAHDFGIDYTAKEVANWIRYQIEDVDYPIFAFEEITKERYDYYDKRKLTTRNFR